MEIVFIVALLICAAVFFLSMRRRRENSIQMMLDEAWRVVLADPNYNERRLLEERKHVAEKQADLLQKESHALGLERVEDKF